MEERNKIMELKHKKIAFLGDSITEGHGVSEVGKCYWNLLAQKSGATCYGYGVGGTHIAIQRTPSPEPHWDRYFASRIQEMIPDADIVVVFGGTNDFGIGDASFGRLSDRTEESFCGAFHLLLQKLIARYPQAQMVVMTPLHRDGEEELGYNQFGLRREHTLEEYAQAIVQISGYYGIPVLDLRHVSGIQPSVPILRQLYIPDGLHPNDRGHQRIAEKLLGFLQSL